MNYFQKFVHGFVGLLSTSTPYTTQLLRIYDYSIILVPFQVWQHHAEPSVHLRHRRAATVRVPRMLPKAYTVQQVAQSIAGYQGSKLQTTYPVILSAEAWWTKRGLTWNGRGSKLHYRGFVLNTNKCLLKKNYKKWGVPVGNSVTLNVSLKAWLHWWHLCETCFQEVFQLSKQETLTRSVRLKASLDLWRQFSGWFYHLIFGQIKIDGREFFSF